MSQATIWKYAGVLSSFNHLLALWDACMKSSSREQEAGILSVLQSLSEGVSLAVSTGREGEELRRQVSQSIHRDVLKWISNHHSKSKKSKRKKKKKKKRKKKREDFRLGQEELHSNLFSVMQNILQRINTNISGNAFLNEPEIIASPSPFARLALDHSELWHQKVQWKLRLQK